MPGTDPTNLVDIHAHVFPKHLGADAGLKRDWPRLEVDSDVSGRIMIGDQVFRKVRASLWDVEARLAELDAAGVGRQLISPVPVTLDFEADTSDAAAYFRALNDGVAESVSLAPQRLTGLGTVPLQDTEVAIDELRRVMNDLDLAGVEIGCEIAGRELDDADLRPFFREANRLGALIFVHPLGGGDRSVRRTGQPYDFGLGMLTDTALAATALVFGGVLQECVDLRVVLAHGCGTFPWAFPRLNLAAALGDDSSAGSYEALVRRLYVDTLVFDPEHLRLVARRFGPGHVLVGSDHPFIPGQLEGFRQLVSDAVSTGALAESDTAGVLGGNARDLLNVRSNVGVSG